MSTVAKTHISIVRNYLNVVGIGALSLVLRSDASLCGRRLVVVGTRFHIESSSPSAPTDFCDSSRLNLFLDLGRLCNQSRPLDI